MSEVNITSTTQRILVDMPTRTVAVISAGPVGPAGITMPSGGLAGQSLTKNSDDDYDVSWGGFVFVDDVGDIPEGLPINTIIIVRS